MTDQAGQQRLCFLKITVIQGVLNQPPGIAIAPPGPITTTAGDAITFTVTGNATRIRTIR
ncbi:MAG: hypothetical protein FJY97_04185 [candidate division Zixibacteria bacterium]|nr:hypothetical protein [candidate division Zixibacteria bacterium]